MTLVTDVAAAVCLLLGAFFSFSAGVGVVRFDNLLSRMHVVAKPQVLGLLLLLAGVALRLQDRGSATMLLLVAIFQLMTSPVAAYMVGRSGLRTRCVDPAVLEIEEDEFPAREAGR
ncbi:monovalent cation/H(+) antiporter subunit G [Promicromonospora sukumoe]|uniref:monovalent cation/H(+) antiporter subunit G n=1 Tax=Promicromonospora sukumoe TaxID=88382 RepID=UPI00035C7342|nr:monovalent cation/H(+) antiporter subunit G [Promicromonospora sukumoe]